MNLEVVKNKVTNNKVKYQGEEISVMYVNKSILSRPFPDKLTVTIKETI